MSSLKTSSFYGSVFYRTLLSGKILHPQSDVTPLWIACQNGHLPVVQHLTARKANVNHPDEVIYHNTHHSSTSL